MGRPLRGEQSTLGTPMLAGMMGLKRFPMVASVMTGGDCVDGWIRRVEDEGNSSPRTVGSEANSVSVKGMSKLRYDQMSSGSINEVVGGVIKCAIGCAIGGTASLTLSINTRGFCCQGD